jgi:hypothetical protein
VKTFTSKLEKNLADCIKQDTVEDGLVGESQFIQLVRHSKNVVKILNRQEFGLALLAPVFAGQTLAVWAMPVSAGVEKRDFMATTVAPIEMPTKSCGSALHDIVQYTSLSRAQPCAVFAFEGWSVHPKHILNAEARRRLIP